MAKIIGTTVGAPDPDEETIYLVHYVGGQDPNEEDETIVRLMKRCQFEDGPKWTDAADYFLLLDDADVVFWVPVKSLVEELARSL